MRYGAIILGVITATLLLSQDAFARGGKNTSKSDRGNRERDVVRERVVPEPVVVEQPVIARRTVESRHDDGHRSHRRPDRYRRGRNHGRVNGHRSRHHSRCAWIPGHYENREREFVVPGFYKKHRVPARYVEHRGPRGHRVKVMIRQARVYQTWVPARTETRTERVWVPGEYAC
jgi:hypothetical protein